MRSPGHLCNDSMPAIPAKTNKRFIIQLRNHKGNKNRVYVKSAKVFRHYKVSFSNQKPKSFVYIRYFQMKNFIFMPKSSKSQRQIVEGETVFEGRTVGEVYCRDALGVGHNALVERGT